MATIPSGFPTAETTGVPAGTTLTTYNGTLVVTQDNTVISGVRFTGNVVINAQNVTMVNCVIDTTTPYHAILIPDGYTGFTLEEQRDQRQWPDGECDLWLGDISEQRHQGRRATASISMARR